MKLKQLTNSEFKTFASNFRPSSMYQSPEYAFTMNEEGYDSFFLGLEISGEIVAASLIIVQKISGFKYALAPRGFLIDYQNSSLVSMFTKQVKKFLKKRDIVAIKINPMIIKKIHNSNYKVIEQNMHFNQMFDNLNNLKYFHLGYNNYFEALKPRFEAIVDLNISYVKLFANIKKTFRTKIRKAEKEGVKVYHGNIDNLNYLYLQTKNKYPRDLNYFKELYGFFDKNSLVDFYYSKLDTAEYLKVSQNLYSKYEKLSHDLNQELIISRGKSEKIMNQKIEIDKEFEKYKNQLIVATNYLKKFPEGIVLSSALIIKWGDTVYLVIDGYDEKYKSFNAKHALIWKLMGRYSKLGFKNFNLGGISNIQSDNPKYNGLNEFKLNFNAKAVEYVGDFELITSPTKYFMFRKSTDLSNMLKPGK